jgi:transposase
MKKNKHETTYIMSDDVRRERLIEAIAFPVTAVLAAWALNQNPAVHDFAKQSPRAEYRIAKSWVTGASHYFNGLLSSDTKQTGNAHDGAPQPAQQPDGNRFSNCLRDLGL